MKKFFSSLTRTLTQDSPDVKGEVPARESNWYLDVVISTRKKLMTALCNMLPASEAEEVIQETYLKLYLNFQQTKPDNPTAYVFRVARNLAISRLRSQQLENAYKQESAEHIHLAPEQTESLYSAISRNVEKAQLLDAINQLSPICRQVFVLRKLQQKSHQEIAVSLNISVKTVENHIAKGMRDCLQFLQRNHTTKDSKAQSGAA